MALIQPVEDGKIPKDTSTTSKSDTSNDLGYDQFLQLLCAEMQYQDPLEPTSNTEYVAQLATFSQMEATLGMQSTIESSNANALVGKYVIIKTTSSTGETTATQGFVDYVQKEKLAGMDNAVGTTCPNCGAPITNLGAAYCEYCGSAVTLLNLKVWTLHSFDETDYHHS